MKKIKLLYWKLFNPALYGCYLELKRVEKEINERKRKHKKYTHLMVIYKGYRAMFELLRDNKM